MDKDSFLKKIIDIYNDTEDKIKKIGKIKVSNNKEKMIDVDMDLYLKSLGYQKIRELIEMLKKNKKGKGKK